MVWDSHLPHYVACLHCFDDRFFGDSEEEAPSDTLQHLLSDFSSARSNYDVLSDIVSAQTGPTEDNSDIVSVQEQEDPHSSTAAAGSSLQKQPEEEPSPAC